MHPGILKIEQEVSIKSFNVPLIMSRRKKYRMAWIKPYLSDPFFQFCCPILSYFSYFKTQRFRKFVSIMQWKRYSKNPEIKYIFSFFIDQSFKKQQKEECTSTNYVKLYDDIYHWRTVLSWSSLCTLIR